MNKLPHASLRIAISWLPTVFFVFASAANAASISGGSLTMNLDSIALASLYGGSNVTGARGLYIEEFLDQSYNSQAITGTNPDPVAGTGPLPSTTGLGFAINGATIISAPGSGRILQPTTLAFVNDPVDGTGKIGLSGALRLRSDFAFGGYITWNELSLGFESGRTNQNGFGESGWVLRTNQPGFGSNALFDLVNVSSSLANGIFNLSGTLSMASDWGSGFLGVPDGTQLGSVSLQTTVVPLPAAVWMLGSGLLALAGVRRLPRV